MSLHTDTPDDVHTLDARRTEIWFLDLSEQRAERIAREVVGSDDISEALRQSVRYVIVTRDPVIGVTATAVKKGEFHSSIASARRYHEEDVTVHIVAPRVANRATRAVAAALPSSMRTSWRTAIRKWAGRVFGGVD